MDIATKLSERCKQIQPKLDGLPSEQGYVEALYCDLLQRLERAANGDSTASACREIAADVEDDIQRLMRDAAAYRIALERLRDEFENELAAICDANSRAKAFSEIIDKETRELGPRSAGELQRLIDEGRTYDESEFAQIKRRLSEGYSDDERLELLAHVAAECVESNR